MLFGVGGRGRLERGIMGGGSRVVFISMLHGSSAAARRGRALRSLSSPTRVSSCPVWLAVRRVPPLSRQDPLPPLPRFHPREVDVKALRFCSTNGCAAFTRHVPTGL